MKVKRQFWGQQKLCQNKPILKISSYLSSWLMSLSSSSRYKLTLNKYGPEVREITVEKRTSSSRLSGGKSYLQNGACKVYGKFVVVVWGVFLVVCCWGFFCLVIVGSRLQQQAGASKCCVESNHQVQSLERDPVRKSCQLGREKHLQHPWRVLLKGQNKYYLAF